MVEEYKHGDGCLHKDRWTAYDQRIRAVEAQQENTSKIISDFRNLVISTQNTLTELTVELRTLKPIIEKSVAIGTSVAVIRNEMDAIKDDINGVKARSGKIIWQFVAIIGIIMSGLISVYLSDRNDLKQSDRAVTEKIDRVNSGIQELLNK